LQENSKNIAHNVPAVYDVFAVAIKERGAFQQPQNDFAFYDLRFSKF
jgi:hypothetical protein